RRLAYGLSLSSRIRGRSGVAVILGELPPRRSVGMRRNLPTYRRSARSKLVHRYRFAAAPGLQRTERQRAGPAAHADRTRADRRGPPAGAPRGPESRRAPGRRRAARPAALPWRSAVTALLRPADRRPRRHDRRARLGAIGAGRGAAAPAAHRRA